MHSQLPDEILDAAVIASMKFLCKVDGRLWRSFSSECWALNENSRRVEQKSRWRLWKYLISIKYLSQVDPTLSILHTRKLYRQKYSPWRQSQQQFDWQSKNQWDQSQYQLQIYLSILKRPQLVFENSTFSKDSRTHGFYFDDSQAVPSVSLAQKSRSISSFKNLISEMFDTRFRTFLSVARWNVSIHCWWWNSHIPQPIAPTPLLFFFIFYRHWKLSISSPSTTRRQGSFLSPMLFPI